jgi:hypothetical protein
MRARTVVASVLLLTAAPAAADMTPAPPRTQMPPAPSAEEEYRRGVAAPGRRSGAWRAPRSAGRSR